MKGEYRRGRGEGARLKVAWAKCLEEKRSDFPEKPFKEAVARCIAAAKVLLRLLLKIL
jgi:hypothetical protein